MLKFFKTIPAIALALALLTAIPNQADAGWFTPATPTSDANMKEDMEKLINQSQRVVGMPSIINFFERSMVRMLYEIRDNPEFRTYSYIMSMQGEYIKVCNSIGYGINASIQFSSPEKIAVNTGGTGGRFGTLPQMEPNGLSMPSGLAATYVLCVHPDPTVEGVHAMYVEPEVIVSPWPMPYGSTE